jgi:hypothetical protein
MTGMHAYDPILVEKLTAINLEDVLISLGRENKNFGRNILTRLFKASARRFAYQVMDYDNSVGEFGLHAGSRIFLQSLLKDLVIEGQENIPAKGPVLFLSNHPGMTDTVSLFASIPRQDLRIVAAERPFLRALPATDPLLIYVNDDPTQRVGVLRKVGAHLRANGAVLTFPGGEIEPDPAVLPGALEALDRWSTSIGVFARLMPTGCIIPVIVSGVLAPKATHHLLTRIRRRTKDRERLGATLQILTSVVFPGLWPDLWNVTVHVRFAPPIQTTDLIGLHNPQEITDAVIERIKPFLHEIIRKENPQIVSGKSSGKKVPQMAG